MKKVVAILVLVTTHTFSQNLTNVEQRVLSAPDSVGNTVNQLSTFINSSFTDQTEKIRAIYIWVAKKLKYDVSKLNGANYYADQNEIIREALLKRKGICSHYAVLFCKLANTIGVKTYLIFGRTRQSQDIDPLPHAWCASLINSKWYLFDPTWASGSISNDGKFVEEYSSAFFKISPEQFIKTHFPFDPIWQFLPEQIRFEDFYQARTFTNHPEVNFLDSLKKYESENQIDQLLSAIERIKRSDEKDQLVSDHLDQIKTELMNLSGEEFLNKFNRIIGGYNDCTAYLNKFISLRNSGFKSKTKNELERMVSDLQKSINGLKKKLNELNGFDAESNERIKGLTNSVESLDKNLKLQQVYLEKYLASNPKK